METQKKHTYRRHVSLTFNAIIAGMLITGSSFSQTVWQETTTGLEETRYLKKIAFGAGKFVALGQMTNGITLISTDGQFWSHVDIGTTNALRGVAFVGNMFVAVGEAGTLTTSPDGSSWTTRSSGVTENLNATAHGNGLFLAIGENGAITRSADGATWTPAASLTNSHHGIVFGNGTFVAVGSDADSANACGQGVIISSTDGLSWTNKSIHTGE